tara:strand:+ start:1002 stop:1253 length:252 start_codon:yes stop_codon:yes gene_type:complete
MNVKKYVGNGKKVGTYDLVNFTISEEKARDSWIDYNGKKYLKLTIGAKKEVDQYGKTHTIWVDEYKPEQQAQTQQKEETDLPF